MEYKTDSNAQNHPIFKDWTEQMRNRYRVAWRDETGIIHLPIIPVIDFAKEEERIESALAEKTANEREAALMTYARSLPFAFPSIKSSQLNTLILPMTWRLFRMAHLVVGRLFWLLRWLFRLLLLVITPFLFGYLAIKIVQKIRKDLAVDGLIKED
jgi:hypothetical protein